jgi:hypothetical protein
MAVKRYNGTAWDTVAGLGAQGANAVSSSITTWVKTAAGGETSLTGSSDSSTTLAYTPGQEQLFINGVLQVRGSDYTATNGTSITGLAALTAGDIATVTTVNAFSVTGAVPLSTVTANGDLIVGTSSGAVGRLGIGSTDQVLKVSGGVPVWATVAASTGTVTQIATGTLSGATVTVSTLSSYDQLFIQFRNVDMSSVTGFSVLINNNTGAGNYNWNGFSVNVTTGTGANQAVTRAGFMPYYQGNLPASAQDNCSGFTLTNCKAVGFTTCSWSSFYKNSNANLQAESSQGQYLVAEAVSSLVFSANAGTFDGGTYTIWGA